jgi:DNA polymerase III delta prime subunit
MKSSKSGISKLWVAKYRPTTIEDIIFQNDTHRTFFHEVASGKRELPNLLLSGVQGTGKTTISLALIKDLNIDPLDVMLVKCSDETGVDNLRDKVGRFAETMPMGNMKVVRMEEADYLSHNAQAVLRHIVEDNSDSCRFIFTCNYVNKIMPALKSRLQRYEFKAPNQEDVIIKMADMLEQEGVSLESEESIIALEKIVSVCYPDIRATIETLQQSVSNKKLTWSNANSSDASNDYKFKLIDYIEIGDFDSARDVICQNAQREEYEELYQFLYQNIAKVPKFKSDIQSQKLAVIGIADYLDKHSRSAFPDITMAALINALSNI